MKNNLQKIAFVIVLGLLVVPQVTFASWWNPFTWGIFNKTDTKIEVLNKRIVELENKLNPGATTTTSVNATSEPEYSHFYIKYDNTRVRSCKSTQCDVLGYYKKNDYVYVHGSEKIDDLEEWVALHTTESGQEGYLNKSVLSEKPIIISSVVKSNATVPESPVKNSQNTNVSSGDATSNEAISKELILQLVNKTKEHVTQLNKAISDSDAFVLNIRSDMAEYPNDFTLQQIGKDVLDNDIKYNSVMKKMVEIETRILEKVSTYANSNFTLTYGDMLPLFNEMSPYSKQYSELGSKVEPLIKSFVSAHVTAINNETARLNIILSEKTQQYNVMQDAQVRLNAINQAKINQYTSIRAVGASEGVTEAVVNGQLNAAGLIKQINCYTSPVGGMTPSGGSITCY